VINTTITPKGPGVRVDSSIYAGYEITPYYDSMIAKLITWSETRQETIQRMKRALQEFIITGVKHNIPFHLKLMNSTRFIAGQSDTRFVEDRFSMNLYETPPTDAELETVAIAATLYAHRQRQLAAQVVAPAKRDTSNWKWLARWERLQR
jgi:acetyl/propionyl-CoA carboxylase alpha subunit